MILSFKVGTSTNENIDHRTETFSYDSGHISLLHDSTMSSAYIFLSVLLSPKRKDHITRQINIKRTFMCEISIIVLIFRKLVGLIIPIQQKIKWSSPKNKYTIKFIGKICWKNFFHRIKSTEKSCCYIFPILRTGF